jgi:hypothetical protein
MSKHWYLWKYIDWRVKLSRVKCSIQCRGLKKNRILVEAQVKGEIIEVSGGVEWFYTGTGIVQWFV